MKRAIVTGCTSFLGIALIQHMERLGIEVYAIARPGSSRLGAVPASQSVHLIQCELGELDSVRLPDEKMDALFHIGWTSDFDNPRFNREGQRINVGIAEKAMRLAERSGCEVFSGVGSQAECGLVNGCITPDTPEAPMTEYAKAKIETFHSLERMAEKSGMKLCWPRLLSAYGPYDRPHTLIMSCIRAAFMGGKLDLTPCGQIWDYVYVDDAAKAIYMIAENGEPMKRYPIGSGVGRSLRYYVEEIAKRAGSKSILKGIGAKPYGENQVMNLLADMTEVEKDTGFVCEYDFRAGIEKTIAHWSSIHSA